MLAAIRNEEEAWNQIRIGITFIPGKCSVSIIASSFDATLSSVKFEVFTKTSVVPCEKTYNLQLLNFSQRQKVEIQSLNQLLILLFKV